MPDAPSVVLLLRAVNVGRHGRLAMADLRALLARLGYEGVRTHGQSGNVVLRTREAPAAVAERVREAIAHELGHEVSVLARTGGDLARVLDVNPLEDVATDGSRHLVVFLDAEPDLEALVELSAHDFGPERFAAQGREIYAWCPDGVQRSPLLAALNRAAGVPGTARNWNTLTKLAALT